MNSVYEIETRSKKDAAQKGNEMNKQYNKENAYKNDIRRNRTSIAGNEKNVERKEFTATATFAPTFTDTFTATFTAATTFTATFAVTFQRGERSI